MEEKYIKDGKIMKPNGNIKKGGYNNDFNEPKIKNLIKINQLILLFVLL